MNGPKPPANDNPKPVNDNSKLEIINPEFNKSASTVLENSAEAEILNFPITLKVGENILKKGVRVLVSSAKNINFKISEGADISKDDLKIELALAKNFFFENPGAIFEIKNIILDKETSDYLIEIKSPFSNSGLSDQYEIVTSPNNLIEYRQPIVNPDLD